MRLSKTLEEAVHFANFARINEIDPHELAELITLCNRAHAAGVREANTGDDDAEKRANAARRRVEAHATKLGYATNWPGLWPTFIGGRTSRSERIDSLPFA